jgi:hypothetical protein
MPGMYIGMMTCCCGYTGCEERSKNSTLARKCRVFIGNMTIGRGGWRRDKQQVASIIKWWKLRT